MKKKTSIGNRGENSVASPINQPDEQSLNSAENGVDVGVNIEAGVEVAGGEPKAKKRRYPTRGNALSARVLMAKQFFLHGDENGNRMLDPNQLAEKVGCAVRTIYQHVDSWTQEHERMLIERNGTHWSVALSEQTLAKYKQDVSFAEKQTEELKDEIDRYDRMEIFLDELLRKFDFSKGDAKDALSAIQAYLQTVGSKKFLREHWMKMEKFWIEISGMQSRISVAETFEKEMAKDNARRKGKGGGGDGNGNTTPTSGGFFDF